MTTPGVGPEVSLPYRATVAIPARPTHANKEVKPVLRDLASGVRFIFGHPVIGFVIVSLSIVLYMLAPCGGLVHLALSGKP